MPQAALRPQHSARAEPERGRPARSAEPAAPCSAERVAHVLHFLEEIPAGSHQQYLITVEPVVPCSAERAAQVLHFLEDIPAGNLQQSSTSGVSLARRTVSATVRILVRPAGLLARTRTLVRAAEAVLLRMPA